MAAIHGENEVKIREVLHGNLTCPEIADFVAALARRVQRDGRPAIGDASILGEDRGDPGDFPDSFAFRQSDSTMNETVRVDNLIVADDFVSVCSTCPPVATESQTWGHVKSLFD